MYRIEENKYNALGWSVLIRKWGKCLVISSNAAPGSEFSNSGLVTNGPVDRNLRTFPVTIEGNSVKISLKAV
ncbi:MAG: hypothetical protein IPN86_00005 [Saprospiraceae bacterium]|nr:hypothetical protein [Saprospiraceae bacterium]